jgi:hypothetical protein
MKPCNAAVLSIDRLGAAWLGPYGNTWLETPYFSRLAAQSLLCETVVAGSPNLAHACRAWWTGQNVLPSTALQPPVPLPTLAAHAGLHSLFITDDPALAAHPLAASFGRQVVVEQPPASAAAREPGETGALRLVEAALAELMQLREPFLLWIHCRGMAGPWDAPLPMRQQFADEDDPQPPEFVAPPERILPADYDPDELLGLVHAYAGQVALTNLALGLLLAALDEHPLRDETLLAVTSPRGYPLGEHLRVGPCDEALYGELLHVPLLVRLPDRRGALARSQQIVQPHDLYAALAEACGWSADANSNLLAEIDGRLLYPRQIALSTAAGQRAIRTPAWFLRESQADGAPAYELFAKPDDRFEANEIASRCQDAVELLAAMLDQPPAESAGEPLAQVSPLPELLTDVWR